MRTVVLCYTAFMLPTFPGAFSLRDLLLTTDPPPEALVEGLLVKGSVNILVGDSGIGKTALGIQLGLCVSGGMEFLGMPTSQGRVLYLDTESPKHQFRGIVETQCRWLGLTLHCEFFSYSLQWDTRDDAPLNTLDALFQQVDAIRPSLVIIDPLRAVWEDAEGKSESSVKMVKDLRKRAKAFGTTFLLLHHTRKENPEHKPVDLLTDPHKWLQEAAGSRALITSTDTRIGVAKEHEEGGEESPALVMSGYTRLTGPLPKMRLLRILKDDDHKQPLGYRLMTGMELLSKDYQQTLEKLPDLFRATEAKAVLGKRGTKAVYTFLRQCESSGLITQDPRTRLYQKL